MREESRVEPFFLILDSADDVAEKYECGVALPIAEMKMMMKKRRKSHDFLLNLLLES